MFKENKHWDIFSVFIDELNIFYLHFYNYTIICYFY